MGIYISDKLTRITGSVIHLTDCSDFQGVLKQIYTMVSPSLWPVNEVNPAENELEDVYDTTLEKYLRAIDSTIGDSGETNLM